MNRKQIVFMWRRGLLCPALIENWLKSKFKTENAFSVEAWMKDVASIALTDIFIIVGTMLFIGGAFLATSISHAGPSVVSFLGIAVILTFGFSTWDSRQFIRDLKKLDAILVNFLEEYLLHNDFHEIRAKAELHLRCAFGKVLRALEAANGVEHPDTRKMRKKFKQVHSIFFKFGLVDADQMKYMVDE